MNLGSAHSSRQIRGKLCRLPGLVLVQGVSDPVAGRFVLPVDALGVDLEQDVDAVPGPLRDLGRAGPRIQSERNGGVL